MSSYRSIIVSGSAFLVCALLPAAALAHQTGSAHLDLASGFAHPLLGVDHVAAMLAIGLWISDRRRIDQLKGALAFSLALALGGGLGISGLTIPGIETAVAGTLVAIGLALALAARPPLSVGVPAVALIGLLHGIVHGVELPAGRGAPGYIAGFVLASFFLQFLGMAAGRVVVHPTPRALRLAGTAVGVLGLGLLIQAL
jgi:urease accessory protein